ARSLGGAPREARGGAIALGDGVLERDGRVGVGLGGRRVEAAQPVDVLDAGREAVQRRVGAEQREVVLGVAGVERGDGGGEGGLVGAWAALRRGGLAAGRGGHAFL